MKTALLLVTLLLIPFAVAEDSFDATEEKLKAAMASDVRTGREKERDRNRRPIQTLKFFGLRDNMKVVELLPGGGWYTKLLAPVLADKGQLTVAFGTSRVEENLMTQPGFDKIKVTARGSNIFRAEGARFYSIEVDDVNVKKADMVLTFRNYHNFAADGRAAMNKAANDMLKKGGIYGVVDHTRRHMEGGSDENRRRFDPVLAIKEIQAAGFEFVDFSDLHYRPDDELRYEVGRKSVTGNTDRFALMFKKK